MLQNIADNPATPRYTFITGGTGLVGAHLITQLVAAGKKVKALYRSTPPDNANGVLWVKGDILDIIFLEEAMEDVDEVYHCAAMVSFNPAQKQAMFAANIEGTANVVNAALNAGVKKLCYVSSVAALGKTRAGKEVDETTPWSDQLNTSNYSKSKYYAEVEVWRGIGEGLKAVIVNPVIILGAGDWNDSSIKIFKTAFDEFPWYTDGIGGFVDVIDVVNAMMLLMDQDISGERFLLSAENRKYQEIFTWIATAFGKKPPRKKVTRFMAQVAWRLEAIKSAFTHKDPLLTAETAEAAQDVMKYNGSKIKSYVPRFSYTPIEETIKRTCRELININRLGSS